MILWHVEPARTVRLFRAPSAEVSCVALSPDGKYVAGGLDGTARLVSLWETASGRLLRQIPMIGPPTQVRIRQLAFSPDSRLVLAACDRNLHAWRVPSGQHALGSGSGTGLVSGGFSADSKQMLIATADGDRVHFSSIPIRGAEDVVVNPPQQPQTPDAWSHLNIPRDIVPNAVLRIPSGRTVATRQEYSGSLDITFVVRGPEDQDVSFIAPGGAMVTFRHTGQGGHVLNVRRPDAGRGEFGSLVGRKQPITLPAEQWCTLHWEINSTGMKVAIDKQLLFQEAVRYDLTAKYPVKIRVNKAEIEVKSLEVKGLKE